MPTTRDLPVAKKVLCVKMEILLVDPTVPQMIAEIFVIIKIGDQAVFPHDNFPSVEGDIIPAGAPW
jgi:hypothetical protein